MRAVVATFIFLLLSGQPLAGAAFCVRQHATRDGAACEAAMRIGTTDREHMADQEDGSNPDHEMADQCAAAMACAAPAPVIGGTAVAFNLTPHLILFASRPLVALRPDAPATPFFRPPIA